MTEQERRAKLEDIRRWSDSGYNSAASDRRFPYAHQDVRWLLSDNERQQAEIERLEQSVGQVVLRNLQRSVKVLEERQAKVAGLLRRGLASYSCTTPSWVSEKTLKDSAAEAVRVLEDRES